LLKKIVIFIFFQWPAEKPAIEFCKNEENKFIDFIRNEIESISFDD